LCACTQASDRIEHVATEHFWLSGMYWGLSALALMGRLSELDEGAVTAWVASCYRPAAGAYGASPRNDPHLLPTLSALQILAMYDRLHEVDAAAIMACA
jgi:geranylgeranyl transferase type-2 subunit beta